MRKFFVLIAGITVITVSCKKKACPKPEVWGVGTWKLTEFYDNGVLQDPSDPSIACLLTETIRFNNNTKGTWTLPHYNNNNCTQNNYQILAWTENTKKKKLMLAVLFSGIEYGLEFIYNEKNEMYRTGNNKKYIYTKQ